MVLMAYCPWRIRRSADGNFGVKFDSTSNVWHFAYGANMCRDVLVRRRGITPISSEAAVLMDYRLVFDQPGVPWIEPCFASITDAPGEAVHGVLYQLSAPSAALIDSYESAAYRSINVSVGSQKHGAVTARAYQTKAPVRGLKPSKRYLDLLLEGAREHALPPVYIARLAEQPCVDLGFWQPFVVYLANTIERQGAFSTVLRHVAHTTVRLSQHFYRSR